VLAERSHHATFTVLSRSRAGLPSLQSDVESLTHGHMARVESARSVRCEICASVPEMHVLQALNGAGSLNGTGAAAAQSAEEQPGGPPSMRAKRKRRSLMEAQSSAPA
jgi:hypothetical protein